MQDSSCKGFLKCGISICIDFDLHLDILTQLFITTHVSICIDKLVIELGIRITSCCFLNFCRNLDCK